MNIPAILTFGFAGFGFLIASFAYKTFRDTANAKVLNKSRVKMFYAFLAFAMVLCGMALFSYSSLADIKSVRSGIAKLLEAKTGHIDRLEELGSLTPEQHNQLKSIRDELKKIDANLLKTLHGE